MSSIPLSLYIHIPWCVQKCPYCDFNSHALKSELPETNYVNALLADLRRDLQHYAIDGRTVRSIFIGGGTPSLFSAAAISQLLEGVQAQIPLAADIEITLEANPGAVEQTRFAGYRQAGVNRLSMGIQSFQPEKLRALGRIHDGEQAKRAIVAAQQAGFDNFNLDLMHGLPNQTAQDALDDLATALSFKPTHLSWYQLTLEPNTAFYQRPPQLPVDDTLADIQQQGLDYLTVHGFSPYEVSAYTSSIKPVPCQHNINYWQFGDYLAIGAGAHGKITDAKTGVITRYWKKKHPKEYLTATGGFTAEEKVISAKELPFEFMLNALRLYQPVPVALFEARTGLKMATIAKQLERARQQGLLQYDDQQIETTSLGKQYLNDLLEMFL